MPHDVDHAAKQESSVGSRADRFAASHHERRSRTPQGAPQEAGGRATEGRRRLKGSRSGLTTRHGGPIERTEDWRTWKAILRQAGVRDARVHDARHTAATLLIEQGVHIRVVQEVLGHTRVTTTERYTHAATLQMKDASERISEALWGHG